MIVPVGPDQPTRCGAPARLKRRSEFLSAAAGTRVHVSPFTVQAARRAASVDQPPRFGLTVTKKVGNAVERNRIRRRFREALRLSRALPVEPGTDYVLVARRAALSVAFQALQAELDSALRRAGAQLRKPRGSGKNARVAVP